jgi:hypothetical protein
MASDHDTAIYSAEADAYLIQDTRTYVGNCVLWWGPNWRGYTSNVNEAGRYTREQAMRQHASRFTDKPWREADVLQHAKPRVDWQDLRDVPARGIVSGEAGETRSGSTPKGQEPGPVRDAPRTPSLERHASVAGDATPVSLLPCPFCGGEPTLHEYRVVCDNNPYCEAQPSTAGQSQREAIAGWNSRPSAGT